MIHGGVTGRGLQFAIAIVYSKVSNCMDREGERESHSLSCCN